MSRVWKTPGGDIDLSRTVLMGVLNVTPDSFSDGGDFINPKAALAQARSMVAEGAHIVDVGGESTRPGAAPVDVTDEVRRVLPVIEALASAKISQISIDTYKAETARAALQAGAHIVNDVWALQRDPAMAHAVADSGAGVVLMHNRDKADETLVIMDEIKNFLSRSLDLALSAGIGEDRIVLDPGIGFGKTMMQNVEIIAGLGALKELGFPVLIGASRKRFIGHLTGIENPKDRLNGTIAAHLAAIAKGADIVRVHDVKPHAQALSVFDPIWRSL
jgi:dihydropteroate synthase